MQPDTKYPGNPGHYEKTKPKNNRNRRKRLAVQWHRKYFIDTSFPSIMKEMSISTYGALQNTKQIGSEKKIFLAHDSQNTKCIEQRKNIKIPQITFKGRPIRISIQF